MAAPTVVITDDEGNTSGMITIMGPGMVSFHMTATTLGAGEWINCLPVWEFGDPSGRYNSYRGFSAAHFWDYTPESNTDFVVRCTVTNVAGETAYAERTVRVTPNTRRVVYIDPNTGVAAPADPTNPSTPYNTIASAVTGESNGSNTEYRFTAGITHSWATTVAGAGKSNIICRSTALGQKFNVVSVSGGLSYSNQGLIRDAYFEVSGKGSVTRMLDARSNGTAIRNCIVDCYSVDPAVAITLGSAWVAGVSGSKSVLVVDTYADGIYPAVFFEGPMMTFLGVTAHHSGTERPWRGDADWVTLYRCHGEYTGSAGKTCYEQAGGAWHWVSECDFLYSYTAGSQSGAAVRIGHNSSGQQTVCQHNVFEKSKAVVHPQATGEVFSLRVGGHNQETLDTVVRNCILSGETVLVGSTSNTPGENMVQRVYLLHNTIVMSKAGEHLQITSDYDNVTVLNCLGVGYVAGQQTVLVSDSLQTMTITNNVLPVALTNQDVRVDGSATRLTWAEFNVSGLGSGNLSKDITLNGSNRPSDTSDASLRKTPVADMAQFDEDYYGNPRHGTWVAGAVDVAAQYLAISAGGALVLAF